MKRKYESEILQICHEDTMGMHKLGLISDERMQEFDEMCLTPEVPQSRIQHSTPKVEYAAASNV